MGVESYDPNADAVTLDAATLTRLLEAAALPPPEFGLSQTERGRFASLSGLRAGVWAQGVAELDSEAIESLIRFFTLAEEAISGWQAGAKSPVIALIKVLKSRDAYAPALTAWIKVNTTNRFLPYGSLMDRL